MKKAASVRRRGPVLGLSTERFPREEGGGETCLGREEAQPGLPGNGDSSNELTARDAHPGVEMGLGGEPRL